MDDVIFLFYVRIKKWYSFFKLLPKIKLPGVKAIILDKLLIELYFSQLKKQTDFSHLFLNSAHTFNITICLTLLNIKVI